MHNVEIVFGLCYYKLLTFENFVSNMSDTQNFPDITNLQILLAVKIDHEQSLYCALGYIS